MPVISAGYDYERQQFDNAPLLTHTLREPAQPDEYVGAVVDLTGIASAHVAVRRKQDQVLVADTTAAVLGAATLGQLQVLLDPAVTALPGGYSVEWRVIWPDGTDRRWPASLLVRRSLEGSTTPIATGPPS